MYPLLGNRNRFGFCGISWGESGTFREGEETKKNEKAPELLRVTSAFHPSPFLAFGVQIPSGTPS